MNSGRVRIAIAITATVLVAALASAGSLAGAAVPAVPASQDGGGTGDLWKRWMLTGVDLTSIDAVSPTDAWAAGSYGFYVEWDSFGDGALAHWDGMEWTGVATTGLIGTAPVFAVDMLTSDQVWATSSNNRILYYDGHSWILQYDPGSDANLYDIDMLSPTNGWAAGSHSSFYHYDGSSWQFVQAGQALLHNINGLEMISATDGWAVGGAHIADGGSFPAIARYNGTTWEAAYRTDGFIMYDVDMLDANYGWAVGENGILLRWDGTNWHPTPPPTNCSQSCVHAELREVHVISPTDAWAVGRWANLWHWNGATWSYVTPPNEAILSSAFFLSPGDGWVVGERGTIHHYDGTSWTTQNSHWMMDDLAALDFIDRSDGWAVGGNHSSPPNGFAHWDGSEWTASAPPGEQLQMNDVDMIASNDVWAVGDRGVIVHWDGENWTEVSSPIPLNINAISMLSPTSGWAVGEGGIVLRYNGTSWTHFASVSGTLRALDMVSENEGWAGSASGGRMVHFLNGTWTLPDPQVQPYTIWDIDMVDANEGWAVGYLGTGQYHDGLILHYLNGAWTQQATIPQRDLYGVQMLNANEGWAVGMSIDNQGTIVHYLNGTWTQVPSPSRSDLYDVFMFDANSGWIVGQSPGPILRYQDVAIPTPTNTPIATASATPMPCSITFTDVQPSDYFYEPVRYLYCAGAISGYEDNTFRPYNLTTRGQLSKIVVLAEGWPTDTTGGPHFTDVPVDNPFFDFIETAYNHQIVSGYSCGAPGEPCPGLYFRWGSNVTRGQLCKIIVLAEGWPIDTTGGPHFTDVVPANPFYGFIETAYNRGIVSGYADHTFRWGSPATRAQVSKIAYIATRSP